MCTYIPAAEQTVSGTNAKKPEESVARFSRARTNTSCDLHFNGSKLKSGGGRKVLQKGQGKGTEGGGGVGKRRRDKLRRSRLYSVSV
jgi:hypothetical protein